MQFRIKVWSQNNVTVKKLNFENSSKGVTFAMNETGDLTESEFRKMQGLVVPDDDKIDHGKSRMLAGANSKDGNGINDRGRRL